MGQKGGNCIMHGDTSVTFLNAAARGKQVYKIGFWYGLFIQEKDRKGVSRL